MELNNLRCLSDHHVWEKTRQSLQWRCFSHKQQELFYTILRCSSSCFSTCYCQNVCL